MMGASRSTTRNLWIEQAGGLQCQGCIYDVAGFLVQAENAPAGRG
jgi:hypothetical protein